MLSKSIPALAGLVFFAFIHSASAQSSGAAGTIDGLVTDPAGSVIPGANVYRRPHNGPWMAFTWRYDSGLVAGSVPDIPSALALTAAQQAAIGFYCNGVFATINSPITSCDSGDGATRIVIPAPGTENDDHNPPRIAPRHLFNIAVGTDNLFHKEAGPRVTLRFSVENLTNKVALYNFLSTFSGTHFVPPRTYQMSLGYAF
jgi:outer membrane receptor protein involved in Fe transport